MESVLTIKYKIKKDCCSCCDRRLDAPIFSDEINFEFSKESILEARHWREISEYPEDLEEIVYEYVWNSIDFWSCIDDSDKIIIANNEIQKVIDFILLHLDE